MVCDLRHLIKDAVHERVEALHDLQAIFQILDYADLAGDVLNVPAHLLEVAFAGLLAQLLDNITGLCEALSHLMKHLPLRALVFHPQDTCMIGLELVQVV